VISYGIANLEAQLGLTLFDRGFRRPVLTEAGQAILADARQVAARVEGLRARARGLGAGLEAEVALAVDVMFPTEALTCTLNRFAAEFPTVTLRLRIEALGAVTQAVIDGTSDIAVTGGPVAAPDGLERRRFGAVRLLPVAAPSHPLAQMPPREVTTATLRDQVQLVLTDRSELTKGRDFAVYSARTWRLSDLGAKYNLLRSGIGWGNMPEPMVREDLAEGRLVALTFDSAPGDLYPLYLTHRAAKPPGVAGRWMMQALEEGLAEPG
jgi:DNA-binding transcriptional LysR family regulator